VTVSLLEILAAARAHAAPLAAESAGYLLLAVADHVALAPRATTADDVELLPDGSVRLRVRRGAVAADESVEQAVRRLLARTLAVSSSVGPALRRAAERPQDAGLSALVRELETALIPVNRSAARRALSRLHRETERARDAGKLDALLAVAEPPPASVDEVRAAPVGRVAAVAQVAAEPPANPVVLAADFPEPSPVALPVVSATRARSVAPAVPAPAPPAVPVLTLTPPPGIAPAKVEFTPEPLLAVGEPAFTKPEPVVQRAKERGSSTPQLGTLVTAQTLPGEEGEHTLRAPMVALDESDELELPIDVDVDVDVDVELGAESSQAPLPMSPGAPQALVDPEPSTMPDVLSAMVALHTGVDADDAPTRIRDVVTQLRVVPAPVLSQAEPVPTAAEPVPTPEPELVDDAWLTQSSLEGVVSQPILFESERVDPEVHNALTWDPGPVASVSSRPLLPSLVIAPPAPEPSPYAPAVLPARSSDVSELLDSFHVSAAAEERELRSALKEIAGLSLTPMPVPIASEG
jgi:hypothetical protein